MHKLKIISAACLSLFILMGLIFYFQPKPSVVDNLPQVGHATDPVPDFKQFDDITEKKQAFFDYLRPAVDAQNDYLLRVRSYLQGLRAKVLAQEPLSRDQQEEIAWLVEEYRVEPQQYPLVVLDKLLRRIDIIPAELVLVQSANESAWGTSRFAVEGYNFFGMWCFVEDCGFVPHRRNEGANHEVARYDDLSSAMYSYMRNLNRHPAYTDLRAIRARLRNSQQEITAVKLAEGLSQYSERGEEYIEELQQMIRINKELI